MRLRQDQGIIFSIKKSSLEKMKEGLEQSKLFLKKTVKYGTGFTEIALGRIYFLFYDKYRTFLSFDSFIGMSYLE